MPTPYAILQLYALYDSYYLGDIEDYSSTLRSRDEEQLYAALQEIVLGDPWYVRHFLQSLSDVALLWEIQVGSANQQLFKGPFNANAEELGFTGPTLEFVAPRPWRNDPGAEYEVNLLVNGKTVDPSLVTRRDAAGFIRLFASTDDVPMETGDVALIEARRRFGLAPGNFWCALHYQPTGSYSYQGTVVISPGTIGRENLHPACVGVEKLPLYGPVATVVAAADRTTPQLVPGGIQVSVGSSANPLLPGEDVILVNKRALFRKELDVPNPVSTTDYLTAAVQLMNIPLSESFSGTGLSFPAETALDVDIRVDGLKLVPFSDYNVVLRPYLPPLLRMLNTLAPGAHVVIDGRIQDPAYHASGYYDHLSASPVPANCIASASAQGWWVQVCSSYPLNKSYYTEVYVDRRRVPPSCVQILADDVVVLNGLRYDGALEVRTEFVPTQGLDSIATPPPWSRLAQVVAPAGDPGPFIDYWLTQNPVSPSSLAPLPPTGPLVFGYTLVSLELQCSAPVSAVTGLPTMTEGDGTTFTVIGSFVPYGQPSVTPMQVDVTSLCDVTGFEPFVVTGPAAGPWPSPQTVTASFEVGPGEVVSASPAQVVVLPKVLTSLQVQAASYVDSGDDLSIEVYAIFADGTRKRVIPWTDTPPPEGQVPPNYVVPIAAGPFVPSGNAWITALGDDLLWNWGNSGVLPTAWPAAGSVPAGSLPPLEPSIGTPYVITFSWEYWGVLASADFNFWVMSA